MLADKEHFSIPLFRRVLEREKFDLLLPIPHKKSQRWVMEALLPESFSIISNITQMSPLYQIVQRCGENSSDYPFNAFLSIRRDDAVQLGAKAKLSSDG